MTKAKVGRPRSEKSREAILDATQALLSEKGSAGLNIEAVARRAGVGKPTIYRWWPSLADIVLDTLLRQAEANIALPPFTTLQETLGRFLRQSMTSIEEGAGIHLRFLMAHAQQDDAFRRRFRDNFTAKRRDALLSIFRRGVEHGEIRPEQNLEMLADLLFGPMWYRLLTGHDAMDEQFIRELVDAIVQLTDCGR